MEDGDLIEEFPRCAICSNSCHKALANLLYHIAWAALTVEERGSYFKKLAHLIREHNEELATLEAMSMGHPKSTYFHAMACASLFDHYSEAGYDMQGATSLNTPGYINMTLRQPYGVAAAIIPWNVPLLMLANKVAPALTVGNAIVLKSSEKAPLTVRFRNFSDP